MSEDHLSRLKALKLYGMAEAWSELRANTGRQPVSNEGMLLKLLDAEQAERYSRSLRYQMKSARFPHHRDLTTFECIGIYTFIVIPVISLQNDFNLSVGGIDSRLTRRYQTLVKQHMTPATLLASAVKDLASAQKSTFATTQAV